MTTHVQGPERSWSAKGTKATTVRRQPDGDEERPAQDSSLDRRLTCTVPEAGRYLGVGRDAAYAAAARGEIPTLRLGRRLVVPVQLLLRMLGHGPSLGRDDATTAVAP